MEVASTRKRRDQPEGTPAGGETSGRSAGALSDETEEEYQGRLEIRVCQGWRDLAKRPG